MKLSDPDQTLLLLDRLQILSLLYLPEPLLLFQLRAGALQPCLRCCYLTRHACFTGLLWRFVFSAETTEILNRLHFWCEDHSIFELLVDLATGRQSVADIEPLEVGTCKKHWIADTAPSCNIVVTSIPRIHSSFK